MGDKFRKMARVVADTIEKHRTDTLNNAISALRITTGKAQEKFNTKYDVFVKQINNETTVLQTLTGKQASPTLSSETAAIATVTTLPKTIAKYWYWYQELTGLDTVEQCRQRVNLAQDKLFACQDIRRNLNQESMILNDKLKDVYGELLQTKRDDPKYVQLTILENRTLQDLSKLVGQLSLLEKEERDHFTQLATAIKEYHDSQTLNAQKYKYLSVLASALLAIISLAASIIYNNRRIADIKDSISKAQQKNTFALVDGLQSMQEKLSTNLSGLVSKLEDHNSNSVTIPQDQTARINAIYLTIGISALGLILLNTVFR